MSTLRRPLGGALRVPEVPSPASAETEAPPAMLAVIERAPRKRIEAPPLTCEVFLPFGDVVLAGARTSRR